MPSIGAHTSTLYANFSAELVATVNPAPWVRGESQPGRTTGVDLRYIGRSTQLRLMATRSGASALGAGQGMRTSRMPS